MNKEISIGRKIFRGVNTILLIILAIITLYPFLYVLFISFSDGNRVLAHSGLVLSPLGFSLDAYKVVFKNPIILNGYINTIFIVVVGVTINLFLTSMGAYFLSRKGAMLKNVIMVFIVFTMYFSGGMIPLYLAVKNIGLYNSLWALILPSAISVYNLIILRTSFAVLPDSLEESAKLDGAGHFTILFKIVIPLSKAVLSVITLYYAVSHWNAWFNAMLFITDHSKFPLQLILREILINNANRLMTDAGTTSGSNVSQTIQYAVIAVATVPILMVYPFIQKYFTKGVMIGALKG